MLGGASVNIGAALADPVGAGQRVLGIQTKLHQWAAADPGRRFDDLFNLVVDPSFLAMAWQRVRGNVGARSAGVDGKTASEIERSTGGVEGFLGSLRSGLKDRSFTPLPVRERRIPKPSGKYRRLGIPTVRDRVVQAALKLVLEPILEADFQPCSYGFRPGRRAQDAIEEIRFYAGRGYRWVLEGDIADCFDEIDHTALLGRLRRRIGDRRILTLVKAFLRAGLLDEQGVDRDTGTGTPQGGILSPLLANLALSALDDHIAERWTAHGGSERRAAHRRRGGATFRLVRYADDFVVLVHGTSQHAAQLQTEVAQVLAGIGLRLAPDKTGIVHLDEGFDFLGFRIQRHRQQGSDRRLIYSYPSVAAQAAIRRKVKQATRAVSTRPAGQLFNKLNSMLRGWVIYFRHSAASTAFRDLQHHLWWRTWIWLMNKHPRRPKKWIISRYYSGTSRWWPEHEDVILWQPASMTIKRHRYRGSRIPTPWNPNPQPAAT